MEAVIGKRVTVKIDRPLGSRHPKYKNILYTVNYGYVEGILAPDGEEQDVYVIGIDSPVAKFTGKVVAVVHRFDDVEEKWIAAPENSEYTKEEIERLVHFQEQFFDSEVRTREEERCQY